MSAFATVRDEWHGDLPVTRLEGEIDSSNADEVHVKLRALVGNRAFGLIVDLSGTIYLDSAGINVLFSLGEELNARQQVLRLIVAAGSPIARMVSITSLDTAFPTYTSVADALAALSD
jgi:anti-anti-sigma factor